MDCSSNTVSSTGQHRSLRVAVEGNIGSGKSTFLTYCQQNKDFDVAFEPISEWTNMNGTNLLVIFLLELNDSVRESDHVTVIFENNRQADMPN